MTKFLLSFILTLLAFGSHAQRIDSLQQDVSPKDGVNALALEFFTLEFSEEQRKAIEGKEIEFIFQVDEHGIPELSAINGIEDPVIIDMLDRKAATLEAFHPQISDGVARPSLYFMILEFPSYQAPPSPLYLKQKQEYRRISMSDFDTLTPSKAAFDMVIGGVVNQFMGRPAQHLGFGGGMKLELSLTSKSQYLFGLSMNIYSNSLKMTYPISNNSAFLSNPPTLLIGFVVGKSFKHFILQSEIGLASQNITESTGSNDPDFIQSEGWSPGLLINFPIQIGKQRLIDYYGSPTLFTNNLNLSFGLRYLSLSLREASGLMAELGLSYRMTLKGIESYKLREDF